MSVDIEELKRLDREATQGPWYVAHGGFAEYDEGFSIGSKIEGTGVVAECWPCSTDADHRRRLLADCKMMIHLRNHLPAIIAELESLREQVKKPDARRLAEAVAAYVGKYVVVVGTMKHDLTSIIERELSAPDKPTGLAAIMGKWPGDETDEQIDQAMKEMGI